MDLTIEEMGKWVLALILIFLIVVVALGFFGGNIFLLLASALGQLGG